MAKKKAKGGEVFVVGSKVKDAIKKSGLRTAGDALDGLNATVAELIKNAVDRAKQNKRQTIRGYDF